MPTFQIAMFGLAIACALFAGFMLSSWWPWRNQVAAVAGALAVLALIVGARL
jgi:hypothetical protein